MSTQGKSTKQVSYPSFFKRIITSTMDILLVSALFTPITSILNRHIFLRKYGAMLAEHDVDIRDAQAVSELFASPEMAPYAGLSDIIEVTTPMLLIHIISMGIYFVGSWYYIGCSPMKYMLGMRIVDENTGKRPKLFNLIWRFLGYSLFIIGIWTIFFTKKNQALHDKLGKTIVVKA